MNIKITHTATDNTIPSLKNLSFGTTFTDKMFTMSYEKDKGWHDACISDYKEFKLSPASLVFHYGQEIFEGQKAYKRKDGKISMFRPEMNVKRFNKSAIRMNMPTINEKDFLEILDTYIWEERAWIPQEKNHSLYVRPTMITTDAVLGVRPGSKYLFFIICSPVGPYFPQGFNPIRIKAEDKYVRAVKGGVGEAKTGGNYAASLKAMMEAKDEGFSQVLWLDASERRYIEEVGTMNIFFVRDKALITPKLTGSILHGITRDSILKIAAYLGYKVSEEILDIETVCKEINAGLITEAFGAGTACTISPVGELNYKGKAYTIANFKNGKITCELYDYLFGIQYGEIADNFNWNRIIQK